MSDNKSVSQAAFAKISNQLGMKPLSETTTQIDPDNSDNDPILDIEGVVDEQTKSQNPLLQYAVASAIGLLVLGIPLSVILGMGGGQTPSASEAPKDKTAKVPTVTTDSPEVERLKTQVALDLQSKEAQKSDPPTVAAKPAETTPPAQAAQPVKPVQPTQPAQPVKPVQPAQPAQPTQPIQPVQSVVATKPAKINRPVAAQPAPQPIPIRSMPAQPPIAIQQPIPVRATEPKVAMVPRQQERFVRVTPSVDRAMPNRTSPSVDRAIPNRTSPTIASSRSVPMSQPVDRAMPNRTSPTIASSRSVPMPQPVAPVRQNEQASIAANRGVVAGTATVAVPIAAQKQLSYQEAVALSTVGAGDETTVSTMANVDGRLVVLQPQLSPNLPLPVGVVVEGHTITPYNSISGKNAPGTSDVAVMLDRPIQLAQGYSLPAGTTIQFSLTVADNGAIQASSKGVYINNTEIKAPPGAFYLTAQDSSALIADQRALRQGDLANADIKTGLWGAAGKVGEVLVQAGNTTSTQTGLLGTSTVQSNSSNPNILGAVAQGAFQPLTQAQIQRSNTVASEVQGLSKLNTLAVNTRVRIFVAMPGVIQIPIADAPVPSQPRFQAAVLAPETPVNPTPTPRYQGNGRTRTYSRNPFITGVAGIYGSDSDYLG
jgi:hypothetical protein